MGCFGLSQKLASQPVIIRAMATADTTVPREAALPRGAYVPFGGGSRICIGKRFGQTEVKLVATMLLQRLRLDALPGRTMTVRQMPTLSSRGGLRKRVLPAEERPGGR